MTSREDSERSSENQERWKYDPASRTENAMMEEGEASADDEGYADDTSFDAQLDGLDWESGEDPFDALKWQIIRNNLEP